MVHLLDRLQQLQQVAHLLMHISGLLVQIHLRLLLALPTQHFRAALREHILFRLPTQVVVQQPLQVRLPNQVSG